MAGKKRERIHERDPRLRDVPGTLTSIDGTLLSAMPKLMQAAVLKRAGLVK